MQRSIATILRTADAEATKKGILITSESSECETIRFIPWKKVDTITWLVGSTSVIVNLRGDSVAGSLKFLDSTDASRAYQYLAIQFYDYATDDK